MTFVVINIGLVQGLHCKLMEILIDMVFCGPNIIVVNTKLRNLNNKIYINFLKFGLLLNKIVKWLKSIFKFY